jgi:DNA replication protein DnaC
MSGGRRWCRQEVDRGSAHRPDRVCDRRSVTLGRRVGATDTARAPSENDGHHVAGSTGVGKTYLACALGQQACRQNYRAIYRRLPRFFQELALARADGSYTILLARFARIDVLVLDDWGLAALSDVQRQDLLEVLEDRDAARSTIITSQLPRDQWHAYLGEPTIADAVLDRVVHNAYPITLKGPSRRQDKRPPP